MTSKLLKNEEGYCRILDSTGNAITTTAGALNCDVNVTNGSLGVTHSKLDDLTVIGGNLLVEATITSSTAINISETPVVGTHGNLFNVFTTTIFDVSSSLDCQFCSTISVFGSVFGAGTSTLKIQFSQEGSQWYDSGLSSVNVSNQDFCISSNAVGARYIRLVHSGSTSLTLTATCAGK